ncbi:hypothetical protein GCM10007894_16920 [Paraferrimonas haliotis]|uniref:Photolyase/cryptochrome alpha/beta domain-containing protein n=2 Tax=Paraferrimonas haliotis TaxID=2013866 RepID=A0AA37TQS9_9GAMM|nr:hypothetical protein GCM10007894_16920 [Paraferrimonas haliotis]
MQLMWFRKDLRVSDHEALTSAMATGTTLAVFIHTPEQWRQHNVGARQQAFICSNLHHLGTALDKIGVPLLSLECQNFDDIPALLSEFCITHKIDCVHVQNEPELNEFRRDRAVASELAKIGVGFEGYQGDCVLVPGTVLNKSQQMFKVFTPFKNAWLARLAPYDYQTLATPTPQTPPSISFQPLALQEDELWPGGEQHAQQRLNRFVCGEMDNYHDRRDHPGLDATSRLSPYLALGVVSARQCVEAILKQSPTLLQNAKSEQFSWLNELIWREFYRHLLVAFPKLSMGANFNAKANKIGWNDSEEDFKAWCDGRTGYPLVDAAMMQLKRTGWMHNRLRMVVASFLTKHLLIDWRKG